MEIIKLNGTTRGDEIAFMQHTSVDGYPDTCSWEFRSEKFSFVSKWDFGGIEEAIENWNEFAETVNGGCENGNQTEADE